MRYPYPYIFGVKAQLKARCSCREFHCKGAVLMTHLDPLECDDTLVMMDTQEQMVSEDSANGSLEH
jgi:hypothetical protein